MNGIWMNPNKREIETSSGFMNRAKGWGQGKKREEYSMVAGRM